MISILFAQSRFQICLLAVLAVALMDPSLLKFGLLIFVCVGANLDTRLVMLLKLPLLACLYLVALLVADYTYQLLYVRPHPSLTPSLKKNPCRCLDLVILIFFWFRRHI
jgi:hypothetical protein